jgi:hypothetical protein
MIRLPGPRPMSILPRVIASGNVDNPVATDRRVWRLLVAPRTGSRHCAHISWFWRVPLDQSAYRALWLLGRGGRTSR